jgi:acetyl-CoA carboxylase carboxyltransferase component
MVEQHTQNLREDLSKNIEATRQDVEATRRDLDNVRQDPEDTRRDLETQLAAVEAQTRRAGGNNADKVKPPKFDGSKSFTVFHRQFECGYP